MIVYLISDEQKLQVDGQYYHDDMIFTPEWSERVMWYLPEAEVIETTNPDFLWVKSLYQYDLVVSPTQSNI